MRGLPVLVAATVASLLLTAIPALTGSAQPVTPVPTPFQTPDTSACQHRFGPPAPVDLSEVPAPGHTSPPPLPVPELVVGGTAMAGCELVLPAAAPPLPAGLSAHAWLVADIDTGAVLAARDPHGRHRPASVIKMLTALVVLRDLDLRAEVIGTEADARQEGSRVGMGPDGRYTVEQLLQGLLMGSGNDAAHALANHLGGVEVTVSKMNALVRRLGAFDTRAATPSGLDGPGASTSAYDMALILRAVMREPKLAAIMSSTLVDFPGFQSKPGFKLSNDNRLLRNYPGAIGGKTGFTDGARHTFVGAAQRDGRRLLVVLLRGEQEPVRMWEQAARLLDYGFALPADTPPVGVLVDGAPPTTSRTTPARPTEPAAALNPPSTAAAVIPTATPGRPVLMILAVLCLVALMLLTALWWRVRSRSPSA